MGEITLVTLSSEAPIPSIPPTSSGWTALLIELLITVLNTPPENAIGMRTMNKTGRDGVNDQPMRDNDRMAIAQKINTASLNLAVSFPIRNPWTITVITPR